MAALAGRKGHDYFNPRSPHGERPESRDWLFKYAFGISIHAPRTGSDGIGQASSAPAHHFNPRSPHGERPTSCMTMSVWIDFNPRSPHGERQFLDFYDLHDLSISIHAPRTGSDNEEAPRYRLQQDFNPRSPHGERLRKVTILSIRIIGFAQKVYHKTVLLRISLAENAVILPKRPRNPVRTSLQKAGGLRFARAIRAAHPYSISSPSGA